MAGNDIVKSPSLTNLDASPLLISNSGQGAIGKFATVEDYATATAAGLQSSASYYKLVRVPTIAIIKSVSIATDAGPNLNGALALDLSWVFSDSTDDGTPSWLQGLIPTSTNTGGTTTIASYSSPNKIYGTVKPSASASAFALADEIFNGLGSTYAFTLGFMNLPLWQIFGFTDGRGYPSDPGGFFDLMAYVATGATTGGACNIYARVGYTVF
jgi:hypothetical protein